MSPWWWLVVLVPYSAWKVRGSVLNWREQQRLTEACRREQEAKTAGAMRLKAWADDPKGGGAFTGQRDAILAHSPECDSIGWAWLPRLGGRTCLGDVHDCDGCDVTYAVEGLTMAFPDCPESWHYYCACCLAKATACPCETEARRG